MDTFITMTCTYYVGRPVKEEGDIDYVPSLFSYSKTKPTTTQYSRNTSLSEVDAKEDTTTPVTVVSKQQRARKSAVIVEADSNVQQTVEVS